MKTCIATAFDEKVVKLGEIDKSLIVVSLCVQALRNNGRQQNGENN